MKKCALLVVLLVLGLSTVSWGDLIGLGCMNPCVGLGQFPCWNPCPMPCPTPCPNPCPTPCPPNPCPTPCPRPGLNIIGGTYFRVDTNFSAYNFGGCTPCMPNVPVPGVYPQ